MYIVYGSFKMHRGFKEHSYNTALKLIYRTMMKSEIHKKLTSTRLYATLAEVQHSETFEFLEYKTVVDQHTD